ncbi:MAG TPA: ABC transporter permease, partial [Ramlibacter sp.]|nr:ABC transporter permease [Ramlibacter sp.]
MSLDQIFTLLVAMLGGALRVGAPFLFVSLGECLTEKSGRINLGLEGVLVLSAVAAFGGSYLSGSAWVGVLCAMAAGGLLAALHGVLCSLPRVNDVATGIALMLLGMGLAFYLGKPLIQPQAPQLAPIELGAWASSPAIRSALQVNPLVPLGALLALAFGWAFRATRAGLLVRMAGDSAHAARALGYSVSGIRIASTAVGGMVAGLGGACLTLFYPGSWNEGISS